MGKTTPVAARWHGGGGAAWFPAGLRQALRRTRMWRGRAEPRDREIRVSGSPKTPTTYRRRGAGEGEGCTLDEVLLPSLLPSTYRVKGEEGLPL